MMGVMAGQLSAQVQVSPAVSDFGSWMAAEQRRIFVLCYRMLQDRDEADMAAQDAFLKAYRAVSKDDGEQPDDPGKWLTRIAVNTCLDRLRSRSWKFWKRRVSSQDEDTILLMTRATAPTAEDLVFARQIRKRMREALDQLSPRQRVVFLLRHYEDRRLEEIAEILDLDLGTVKAHMARALAKLRGLLADLYSVKKAGAQRRGV